MDKVKPLTAESFEDALTLCYQNRRYRVIIFFNSTDEYIEFVTEFRAMGDAHAIPGVTNVSVTSNHTLITFSNKSNIEIMLFNESSRAKRSNMVLYDEALNIGEYRNIIYPMIVRYINLDDHADKVFSDVITRYLAKRCPQVDEDDLPELDEFLDGFKIIKNT